MDPLLADRLRDYHLEAGGPAECLRSIDRLKEGAQAVVTGQQTGLLGGPLLTWLKTLTAIRLADEAGRRTGVPHVPVFWAEGEDHDMEEVNQAATLDGNFELRRFELPCPEPFRGGPAGNIPLDGGAAELVDRFFEASGGTEFTGGLKEGILGDLEGAQRLSRWFCRQMIRLFGRFGLVVLESNDRRYKELARPFWVDVLEDPLALTEGARSAGEEISRLGYRPILVKEKRRCPFFLITGGERLPVFFERRSFRVGERQVTPLEMRRRLDEKPDEFSPGVVLRPLLQDWHLPTAAYVGGPTELSYLLQVVPGYRWAGLPVPALFHRAGLSLVEPAVKKVLRRRKTAAADLRHGIDTIMNSALRKDNRLADPRRWEKLRESQRRSLDRFAASLPQEEKEVEALIGQTAGKIDFLLKELEKKAVSALRRRSEVLRDQLARSQARLFPEGRLQERVLSPWYFMNKYGPDLLQILGEKLPDDFTRHYFGTIIP